MKKKNLWKAAALMVLVAGAVIFTVPAFAGSDQMSYWDRFRMVFIDWNDTAQPGQAKTEVTGVRGLNVEEALGKDGYDWDAVYYMEDYKVSENDEMKFLQEGKIGPFQGQ
ncbi:MAG TPA: hypothetical protein VM658_02290 [bacterium]|nr:hypothetical protein [bacterium]